MWYSSETTKSSDKHFNAKSSKRQEWPTQAKTDRFIKINNKKQDSDKLIKTSTPIINKKDMGKPAQPKLRWQVKKR